MAKPTITDVARLAGVSKKTVSRVINRSPLLSTRTRARVEAIIAELGYVPSPQARALALRRNFVIALAYVEGSAARLAELARGMLEALAGSEFALVLRPLGAEPRAMFADFRQFVEQHRPYGVLLLPPAGDSAELLGIAHVHGCRTVSLGTQDQDAADDAAAEDAVASYPARVISADRLAVAGTVSWLVSLGHTRIALVTGPEQMLGARQRELGFLDAMADHGLDRGAALIANGDDGFASGLDAGRLLLQVSPPPSAIVATSDEMATGVLHAATAIGIAVPRALSVVGFGGGELAEMTAPPLTKLTLPLADMARVATRTLVDPASTTAADRRFVPALVVRRSTGSGVLDLTDRA